MSAPLRVGFAGLGGVAQGLVEIWAERPDPRFRIVWAADTEGSIADPNGLDAAHILAAKRGPGLRAVRGARFEPGRGPADLLAREGCDVLVNLLPCNYENGEPGLSLLRSALEDGVHVVTAEKASLVLGFETLRRSADVGHAHLRYSACVGGSIPFVPTLEWVKPAARIRRVQGVLNATTTYLLSELESRRHSVQEILSAAQRLGILERDPRHDTEGYDLAAKGLLVHNTAFDEPLVWSKAERRGITEFLEHPEKLRVGTRLVANVEPGRVRVETVALPLHSPLRVYGLENAALIETLNAGELFVRGIGAGGRGTASNVYSDLIRIHQLVGGETIGRSAVPPTALHPHV